MFEFEVSDLVDIGPGHDRPAGRYRVTTTMPTPGVFYAFVFFLFAVLYYAVFASIVSLLLSGSISWLVLAPASVLATNSLVRLTLKIRERWGVVIGHDLPVGRQRLDIRMLAMCIGFLLGAVGGVLSVAFLPVPLFTSAGLLTWLIAACIVGAFEAVFNGVRIGGGMDHIRTLELEPVEHWERLR